MPDVLSLSFCDERSFIVINSDGILPSCHQHPQTLPYCHSPANAVSPENPFAVHRFYRLKQRENIWFSGLLPVSQARGRNDRCSVIARPCSSRGNPGILIHEEYRLSESVIAVAPRTMARVGCVNQSRRGLKNKVFSFRCVIRRVLSRCHQHPQTLPCCHSPANAVRPENPFIAHRFYRLKQRENFLDCFPYATLAVAMTDAASLRGRVAAVAIQVSSFMRSIDSPNPSLPWFLRGSG